MKKDTDIRYCVPAFLGAAIPSIAFLLLAPEKYTRFTLCLYSVLCVIAVCVLLVIERSK